MQISTHGLAVGFGATPVLDHIKIAAGPGEMIGLIGPNGSGKTTLLRTLCNLHVPLRGNVRYDGRPAIDVGARQLARQIAFLPQNGDAHWPMRVDAVVGLGRLPHAGVSSATDDAAAIDLALAQTDTLHLKLRTMTQLSGGERMRVLLARALAVEAPMLLADEPIAALDPLHQLQIMQLLRKKVDAGGGVIVVMHDLSLAARFCDRLVLAADGTIQAQGAPVNVLTDEMLAHAFGVTVARADCNGIPFLTPWSPTRAR